MWQLGFPVNFLEIWIHGITIYFPMCDDSFGVRGGGWGGTTGSWFRTYFQRPLNLTLPGSWGVPHQHEVQYVLPTGYGVYHLHHQIVLEGVLKLLLSSRGALSSRSIDVSKIKITYYNYMLCLYYQWHNWFYPWFCLGLLPGGKTPLWSMWFYQFGALLINSISASTDS